MEYENQKVLVTALKQLMAQDDSIAIAPAHLLDCNRTIDIIYRVVDVQYANRRYEPKHNCSNTDPRSTINATVYLKLFPRNCFSICAYIRIKYEETETLEQATQ